MNNATIDIPFYRKRDIDQTLTKRDIARTFPREWTTDALKSGIEEDNVEWATTSGTTSDRLQIARPRDWWDAEYQWLHNTLYPKQKYVKRAVLTTANCSSTLCAASQPDFNTRCVNNALYLNTSHDPNTWGASEATRFIGEIEKFKPHYLLADPVYLLLFIKNAQDFTDHSWPFDKIVLGYELMTRSMEHIIRSFFQDISIHQLYGSTETGFHILEGENGKLRLREDDSAIRLSKWKDDIYSVYITSFKNPYMPLVNYEIGDLVWVRNLSTSENPDSIHGFYGRSKDLLQIEGQFYSPGEIDKMLAEVSHEFAQYQIGYEKSECIFQYTTLSGEPISKPAREKLVRCISMLGVNPSQVRISHIHSIAPLKSGKFSNIINDTL